MSIPNFVIRNEHLEDDFIDVLRVASQKSRINKINLTKDIKEIDMEIRDLGKTNSSKIDNIEFRSEEEKDNIKKFIYSRESSYNFFGYNLMCES